MLALSEVKTIEEAQKVFDEAVRNLDSDTIGAICNRRALEDQDSPVIQHARAAWDKVQELGFGAIDLRSPTATHQAA